VISPEADDLDNMVDQACRVAHRHKIAKAGDRIIITVGVPLGIPGTTNMLRIASIDVDGKGSIHQTGS